MQDLGPKTHMGAELARDDGSTCNINASTPTAIASKLSSHRDL
jgi:hypothetical protein